MHRFFLQRSVAAIATTRTIKLQIMHKQNQSGAISIVSISASQNGNNQTYFSYIPIRADTEEAINMMICDVITLDALPGTITSKLRIQKDKQLDLNWILINQLTYKIVICAMILDRLHLIDSLMTNSVSLLAPICPSLQRTIISVISMSH